MAPSKLFTVNILLINHSVIQAFECFFPIYHAFNISTRCSARTTQPETIFVCLYSKKTYNIAFTYVNPFLFLISLIIFVLLLFNFGLTFNTISLFSLKLQILFGFLPIKEKLLGLLELASKI